MIVFPDNKAKTHHSKNLQNQSQCIKKLPKTGVFLFRINTFSAFLQSETEDSPDYRPRI